MSRIVQPSHLHLVLALFLTIVLNCLVVQQDGGGSRVTTALQAVKMRVLVLYRLSFGLQTTDMR